MQRHVRLQRRARLERLALDQQLRSDGEALACDAQRRVRLARAPDRAVHEGVRQ